MSHNVKQKIVAFHLNDGSQLLFCVKFGLVNVQGNSSAHWLIALLSDFKLVIKADNRILGLVLNFLKSLVDMSPEIFAKYFSIVKCVTDQAFDLFLDRTIEILQGV